MKNCVVHVRHSDFDVYIGRRCKEFPRSMWANPFKIGRYGTRKEVIDRYEQYVRNKPELMAALPELKGKVLGCWCLREPVSHVRKNKECHGEVLVKLVEELDRKEGGG